MRIPNDRFFAMRGRMRAENALYIADPRSAIGMGHGDLDTLVICLTARPVAPPIEHDSRAAVWQGKDAPL